MRAVRTSIGNGASRAHNVSLFIFFVVTLAGWYWLAPARATARRDRSIGLLADGLSIAWVDSDERTEFWCAGVCERLVTDAAVLAVRMWDVTGCVVADSAIDESLLELLETPPAFSHCRVSNAPVEPTDSLAGGAPLRRVDLELGEYSASDRPVRASLILADDAALADTWGFPAVLGLLCIGLMCCARWRLSHHVDQPLARLARADGASSVPPEAFALIGRRDEWGAVARGMVAIQQKSEEALAQVERVERRMNAQLSEQAERIMRDVKRLQREAWLDPLTGVKNRRLLEEKLPRLFATQQAARQDLSLVMIDLDHFKKLNDAQGHRAGDEVLRFAGELFRQCLRGTDLAVRYGGDEFVLILPGIGAMDALAIVRRIASMFAQRVKVMTDFQPAPTMTAGIASLRNNQPRTPEALIACADHALYQAKQSGRGRSRVCQPDYRVPKGDDAPVSTIGGPHL
ncbi:MAG: hypothetical protein DCC65_15415 [Planctomycetota bacterium]|nr:MAG: hypothetical protein DCC65_15415 [Planctomycetota bacterium]